MEFTVKKYDLLAELNLTQGVIFHRIPRPTGTTNYSARKLHLPEATTQIFWDLHFQNNRINAL